MVTNVLLTVTNILPMMTDVSQEIEYCQPTNSCKNGRKMEQRWVGNTAFANELPDSLVLSVTFFELVGIGAINCLSGTIIGIGGVPNKFSVADSKVGIGDPMTSAPDPNLQIKPYHHRLPSITEYPRVKFLDKNILILHKRQPIKINVFSFERFFMLLWLQPLLIIINNDRSNHCLMWSLWDRGELITFSRFNLEYQKGVFKT